MATSTKIRRRILTDSYPINSSVLYPIEWEHCVFQVLATRDLVSEPLTVEEFLRDPMQRISRHAYTVEDLESYETRIVYQRLLRSHYKECPIRVGIFKGPKLIEMLSTNWGATVADRNGLRAFLEKHIDHDLGAKRIGIFSDDGEVVTTDSIRSSVR